MVFSKATRIRRYSEPSASDSTAKKLPKNIRGNKNSRPTSNSDNIPFSPRGMNSSDPSISTSKRKNKKKPPTSNSNIIASTSSVPWSFLFSGDSPSDTRKKNKRCTSNSKKVASSSRSQAMSPDDLDVGWDKSYNAKLHKLALLNLNAIFQCAIIRIMALGHAEELVTRSMLNSSGLLNGPEEPISNIVKNTLAILGSKEEQRHKSMEEMEKRVLQELVAKVDGGKGLIGDSLWRLITCDMNIHRAIASEPDACNGPASKLIEPPKNMAAERSSLLREMMPVIEDQLTEMDKWTNRKVGQAVVAISKVEEELNELRQARISRLKVQNESLRKEREGEIARAEEGARASWNAITREKESATKAVGAGKEKESAQKELEKVRREARAAAREVEVAEKRAKERMVRWRKEERAREEVEEWLAEARREREAEERWRRGMADEVEGLRERKMKAEEELRLRRERGTKEVKRGRECKVCLTEEATVVFLPCCHQVACAACNRELLDHHFMGCISCRTLVKRRIPTSYAPQPK